MLLADISRQAKIAEQTGNNNREDQIERTGELCLTSRDVEHARRLLKYTDDPSVAYRYLAEEGWDAYAKLALGVTNGDSLAGQAAVTYLHNVADEHEKSLNDKQIKAIYNDMLLGHLDTLQRRLDSSDYDIIFGDINHKEAGEFHKEVFEKHGLPLSAWTLDPVFKLMPEDAREGYWQSILKSAGNPSDEIVISINTFGFMLEQLEEAPASAQPEIHQWLWAVSDIDNLSAVGSVVAHTIEEEVSEKIDAVKEWFANFPMPDCYPNSMICDMNWQPEQLLPTFKNVFSGNYPLYKFSDYINSYPWNIHDFGIAKAERFDASSAGVLEILCHSSKLPQKEIKE